MKISIIVPVYNNADFLTGALESVKEQGVDDLELIIINDGSTDESEKVIDAFVSKNDFAVKISQENQGVSAARNAGLDIATGEYIGFLDSDDAYSPMALADMLFIAEKWNADMVIGESRSVGTFQTTELRQSKLLSEKAVIRKDDPLLAYNFSVCNKIFRREIIEKHHIRFQKIKHAEDGLFLFTFLKECDVITGCPKYVYEYHKRISLESTSALKSLDKSMFDSVIHAVNSIKEVTSNFSDSFKSELDLRMLRVTLINEYYRRLWTLDQETETALLEEVEKYRQIISSEAWDSVAKMVEDLEAEDGLRTKDEILSNPLVSVLIPAGLDTQDYKNILSTLYFQLCPNFEVIIDSVYEKETDAEYRSKENLLFSDTGEDGWKDLFLKSKGRFIHIAAEPCVYNENTLQLMLARIRKSYYDFISVRPIGYYDGIVQEIEVYRTAFKSYNNISDDKRSLRNQCDRIWSNKLFRRSILAELLSKEEGSSQELLESVQRRFTCGRFLNVLIGFCGKRDSSHDSVWEQFQKSEKKKQQIQWFVIMRKLVYTFSRFLPLKEKDVLFLSDIRGEIGGNFLPMYTPLTDKGYHVICDFKPSKNVKEEKQVYLKRMIHLARAKYIVLEDFHKDTADIKVRRGQELCQLWHAAGAYKKFAWSRLEGRENISIHPGYKKYTKAIVSSEEIRPVYADAFHISTDKVAATGIPRTDIFFDKEYARILRERYEEKYPVLKGKKIVLFAPTYRGSNILKASYPFQKVDPEMLHEALGDGYVFVYKWHPAVYSFLSSKKKNAFDLSASGDYAIDLTQERDINEWLIICDLMITDYSSVIFEFALTGKPIIYYWFDINDNYLGRGTYFEMDEYVYGKVAYDEEQLIDAIRSPELHPEKREIFMTRFMAACDGNSTEKTIDWIFAERQ